MDKSGEGKRDRKGREEGNIGIGRGGKRRNGRGIEQKRRTEDGNGRKGRGRELKIEQKRRTELKIDLKNGRV